MNREILVHNSVEGFHNWSEAPEEYSYLRARHRHIFIIKTWFKVSHNNREIEINKMAREIQAALGEENPPLGIALYMQAEHLCKTMRGVKKQGLMSCSRLTGIFKTDASCRSEFMSICRKI